MLTVLDRTIHSEQTASSERTARLDEKLRRELGETILAYLLEPSTEDIVRNPDGKLWVKKRGRGFVQIGEMGDAQALGVVGTVAGWKDTVINHQNPILERELPLDGSRFEALVTPVTTGPVFAIRMRPRTIYTLEDYVAGGILTHRDDPLNRWRLREDFVGELNRLGHAEVINKAVAQRKNILVVGSAGAGKTTLANAILNKIATDAPNDRVLIVEDTPELQCSSKNHVSLLTASSVGVEMVHCVKACMRLRPTRIVVGEVRDGAALELLKAWNTGHPGGLATVHANDAYAGLVRVEQLVAEATNAPQQTLIAEAVDLVVFIDEEPSLPAGRKVREVAVVTGYDKGHYQIEHV